jgi:hypothetical protein
VTATPIGGSTRYIPEGVRQFYWVPAIASKASPTRAELDAGTDLTPEINTEGTWDITSADVATPVLAARFTGNVPGLISANNTTINMYASEDSTDVRDLLPRDTSGFIVMFPEGDVATRTMDVFPVRVASAAKPTQQGGNPATVDLVFSVTDVPAENVTVPA